MSCTSVISLNDVTAKLREQVGTNDGLFLKYELSIKDGNDFSKEFKTKLKERFDIDADNIPADKLDKVVEYAKEFSNALKPDINYSVNEEFSDVSKLVYGYNSFSARDLGIRICANRMYDIYHQILHDKHKDLKTIIEEQSKKLGRKVTRKEYFANVATLYIKNEIINRLVERGLANKESLLRLFKDNDITNIEKLFGNTKTIQDKNLLAIYKEIKGNRVGFFNSVFLDSRLGEIRIDNAEQLEEDASYEAIENQFYDDPQDGPGESESPIADKGQRVDHSTEKFGDFNNFMTHVDMSVKSYLGSLKKLHSGNDKNGKPDFDLDNEIGLPDSMNADKVAAVLYSDGDYTNLDTMIASIRDIANRIHGFAGLHEMVKYLKANRDFAYEIYRTFGKYVCSKLETVANSEEQFARNSNYSADKVTALKFEYFNSSKSTSIINDELDNSIWSKAAELAANIKRITDDLAKNNGSSKAELEYRATVEGELEKYKLDIVSELSKQLRSFYPTLEGYSISNYIKNANNGDIVKNIEKLVSILKTTVEGAKISRKNYDNRRAEIGQLYKQREAIIDRQVNGERVPRKEIQAVDDALAQTLSYEYVSDTTRRAAFELANELVHYAKVKTELNSRNVHGNQSSDVLNISMISNIIKTLQSETSLNNFGKFRFQSRQYDFSNIMIETKDEDGKIINYGLFTRDEETKQLVPTTYAQRLIKAQLFSGASDSTNPDNSALYSEMSKGDYVSTAFINFFNIDKTYEDNTDNIIFANYFMRIPSDAPKNFLIRAPRYSARGLFSKGQNGEVIVNTKHPIYQQFRKLFIQELTDASTALHKFFETKTGTDGCISLSDDTDNYGMPIFRGNFDNSEDTARRLYAGYHVGKGKTILTKNPDTNRYELTGSVFKSDRFTITKVATETVEVNGKTYHAGDVYTENYGAEMLEAFDFLYGGANDSYIHVKTTEEGKSVYLTQAQESKVEEVLSRFLVDYVQDGRARMAQYKSFISPNLYNDVNIAEFLLNHHLMYANFNDLFEGDTKYYKDSQTFLKRAKESQASGVPYGLVDYNMDLTAPRTRVLSALDTKRFEITKEDGTKQVLNQKAYDDAIAAGKTEEEARDIANTIEQTNKFRGVTIKNTIRTGKTIGEFKRDKKGNIIKDENGIPQFKHIGSLSKHLIEVFKDTQRLTDEEAKAKVAKMMAGYADTTVNDAQSYITFEEWVRRISARGQLEKYMPLIERILDESKPLDDATIKQFVQVQKNIYYDQYYNEELGCIAPRQIKNAEFVLVPRLIKGTELEQIYDLMKKNGIDQLNTEETSKAGKCNVLTLWDEDGNLTQENIDDFNTNAARSTELYNYNYLYTQQETPQHMNAQNKAGIQIMKKIVDNIPEDSPLKPLKDKFFKLYSENIFSSFKKLMKEFNLKVDEEGNLKLNDNDEIEGLNKELFYERLQEEVARLGLDSNMMDYVTLSNDGDTMMPSYLTNVSTKLESIAQSLFNSRITRQKLPGFHAAQITNVGWKPFGEQVKKRTYSKELTYHPDLHKHKETGKVLSDREYKKLKPSERKNYDNIGAAPYVEIMLPKSNFNLQYTKEDGTLKSDEELLKELQDSGLDTVIGYRIPTEGKQSICIMKVVGFTDDALGSTIVVPDDWVAQTGSDFDIDSVYGIHFKSYINKKGKAKKIKYNPEKPSTDGRNNELLETMIAILSSPYSLEENLARSNFDGIKDANKKITPESVKAVRSNRSPYNFLDQADYQEDVMSGAKLKAFSVTRDTFLSICNTTRPTLAIPVKAIYKADIKDSDSKEVKKEKIKKFKKQLEDAFEKVEEIREGEFVVTHDTFGWSKNNKNVAGEILTTYSSQTTAHILDAVKEGAVTNVNDYTFQVYKTFPDIGCDYETAVAFMSQPAVSAIVRAYNSNKSIYINSNRNPIRQAIREIATKLLAYDNIKIDNKTSFANIIKSLQKYNNDIVKLFNVNQEDGDFKIDLKDGYTSKLCISKEDMQHRLDASSPVESKEQLLFDLGVALQFNRLYNFGQSISSYARVCNPDKFGAKQSIYETIKVFDDIVNLKMEQSPALKGQKGRSIINDIYPGIYSINDAIKNNSIEDSAYPPLYAFLKYATATSIKINRDLFLTKSEGFMNEINKLAHLFSNGKMDYKTYKDFENYVLNFLYANTDAVQQRITYVIGDGFNFRPGTNIDEERRRIFGYDKTSDLNVPDGKGGMTNFVVEDINNPTQREINQFATLSPAQKVAWIQEKFDNSGVFKYLRTSLFNGSKTTRPGMQTIQFVEGNDSIETVYHEFEKCFFNKNPFVALAALDLIKYGFVVEGFKMRRNAVNKIIKNNALYLDESRNGTNIVAQLNYSIKNITDGSINMDDLREKYIRSHATTSKIKSSYIKPITETVKDKYGNEIKYTHYALQPNADGIIRPSISEAIEHGLAKESDNSVGYEVYPYVRLRFGKNTILYKVVDANYEIIAYPLNTLEENEHSEWSVNNANNKYLAQEYYESLIKDYEDSNLDINTLTTFEEIEERHAAGKSTYQFTPKAAKLSTLAKTFNINEKDTRYTVQFEKVIDKVIEHEESMSTAPLYVHSSALGKFITHTGSVNASIQKINGKYYRIQRVSLNKQNEAYIDNKKEVRESNPYLQQLFEYAQSHDFKIMDGFLIERINDPSDSIRYSSIDEEVATDTANSLPNTTVLGVKAMRAMAYRRSSEGDVDAANSLKYLHDKNIVASSASVSQNTEDVVRVTAEYVQNVTEKIFNNLNYFVKDAEGITYSVADSKVIDLIRNDEAARNKFLKTLLDARALVKQFSIINELDVDSEDETTRLFLKKIKDSINKLQNATIIANAENKFANEFLAKLSNNPRIQDGTISVLDGYYGTGAFDAWVNDLQETSNPLLQIVTKEVMADIRSKEMMAAKTVKEFKKNLNEIKERAKKAGVTINWKHIIDDNGKFIKEYNQAFVDKIASLRDDMNKAKIEFGEGSYEHLTAKLAYDKWKLDNTNQMLVDEYYRARIALEEKILLGDRNTDNTDQMVLGDGNPDNTGFRTIYCEYQRLKARQREIYSHAHNGVLDETYQEEYRKVKQELDNLTETYYFDQTQNKFVPKMSYFSSTNPLTGTTRTLYSLESARALQAHLKAMKALNAEYFEESEKFAFQEQLDKNLDIINNYEQRDNNGRITVPIVELLKHDDYVQAKQWIETNTKYVVNQEIQERINIAFRNLKEKSEGRQVLKRLAKKYAAYDSHGVIDATKFSDEDIAELKKEQMALYNIRENQPFSDRTLISNAPTDDTIFSSNFYKAMTLDGAKNEEYIAKVNEINNILRPHWYPADGTVHTAELSIEDLRTLSRLYSELEDIKSKGKSTNGKDVHKFIKDHVDFVYDMVKFEDEKKLAQSQGETYLRIWRECNEVYTESGERVPNRYLWGYAKPKGYKEDGTGDNTYVDRDKTEAIRTIKKLTVVTKTQYYYAKLKEMQQKPKAEFDAWYEANHIYNPNTHTLEPLQCWTTLKVNPDYIEGEGLSQLSSGMYVPSYNQTDVVPKKDKLNSKYKVGKSTADNYKGGIAEYENEIQPNGYEREIIDLFQDILKKLAKTEQAKRFLDKGYMVARAKKENEINAKFIGKETAKLLGWINTASGKEAWYPDDRIDYSADTTIDMPMTTLLKSKDSVEVPYNPPIRNEDESIEDYNKRLDEYNKKKKDAEETNVKIHKDLLDNNWESVMEDFIIKAAHFNAIQDNKYMLFYAKQMIDKLKIYSTNLGFNDLEQTGERTEDGEKIYVTKKDTRLQEQYTNWIRRLVYDQWKKPNNKITKAANIMQSLTSAKFMMLNITGGIANVTVGSTQVLAEMLGREYLGTKAWAQGSKTYFKGIGSYFTDMWDDKATTLQSAIIKFMNVVDFDENTGSVNIPNATEYVKRARDIMFSPQAMGEHLMQNGAMFAMMHSNRMFLNGEKDKNGKLTYELYTEEQYIAKCYNDFLLNGDEKNESILTEEQKVQYKAFVKKQRKDANTIKEYAWFRKEYATEFVYSTLSVEQQKAFIEKRKAIEERAKKEFNDDKNHPTLYSQLKLGDDGKLDFKEDSILSSMGDEAYKLLGAFKGRVISVNKKIHGVYDKLGAAKWESYCWGGLVMQYHKHIYPGIMKRYRRQGYFNEERGTIEKGCYASLKDFLALPLRKEKYRKQLQAETGATEAEISTLKGIQNIARAYVDFALHVIFNYNLMSEYDKANIRRAFGDLIGVLSAVAFAIALRCMYDDDDEGIPYNLMMYEADRLASESAMYNPFGLYSEGKKLWSSPIAFMNSISDGLSSLGLIIQTITQNDEFDPYYKSGAYAGENKLLIRLKRNIPMYHGIYMLERLDRNNKYYKLGENMLSVIPTQDIADWITD